MIELVLPVPPSLNKIYGRGNKRVYLIQAAKTFKAEVYYEYIQAVNQGKTSLAAYKDDVQVNIKVYRKANRGDGDNFIKALFDSLNGLAWVDDKQVQKHTVERLTDKDNPRLEMQIWDRWREVAPE